MVALMSAADRNQIRARGSNRSFLGTSHQHPRTFCASHAAAASTAAAWWRAAGAFTMCTQSDALLLTQVCWA